MRLMTQYVYELFIDKQKPVTKSQYLVMLSMLWTLTSFYMASIFLGYSINIFLAQQGVMDFAEHIMLTQTLSIFFSAHIPWGFTTLILAILCIRKVYQLKSYLLSIILGFTVFVFFRVLLTSSSMLSNQLSQTWSAELFKNIDINILIGIAAVLLIIGLITLIYPLFTLTNTPLPQAKQGISREGFAKNILYLNLTGLVVTIVIMLLIIFDAVAFLLDERTLALAAMVSIFLIIYFIILMWKRLKNAGKGLLHLLSFFGLILIGAFSVFIVYATGNYLSTFISSLIIPISINLTCLFICYLYLIPSVEELDD